MRLGDIAVIHDGYEDTDQYALFHGRAAVRLTAYRVGDQTPSAVADAVKDHAETLRAPPGVRERSRPRLYTGRIFADIRSYADLLLMSCPQALVSGRLMAAAGDGEVGYVTRADCAKVAAAALATATATATGTSMLDTTGPRLVGQQRLLEMLSKIGGKKVTYVPIGADQLRSGMVEHGLPERIADLMASIDTAISAGTLAVVSSSVEDLTGSKPRRPWLTSSRSTPML